MTKRIPAHIREQQINNLPNIVFVRWDGYTEWRKWTPELTEWFSTWKLLTPKENENV